MEDMEFDIFIIKTMYNAINYQLCIVDKYKNNAL
jgi:hypothetical protein